MISRMKCSRGIFDFTTLKNDSWLAWRLLKGVWQIVWWRPENWLQKTLETAASVRQADELKHQEIEYRKQKVTLGPTAVHGENITPFSKLLVKFFSVAQLTRQRRIFWMNLWRSPPMDERNANIKIFLRWEWMKAVMGELQDRILGKIISGECEENRCTVFAAACNGKPPENYAQVLENKKSTYLRSVYVQPRLSCKQRKYKRQLRFGKPETEFFSSESDENS